MRVRLRYIVTRLRDGNFSFPWDSISSIESGRELEKQIFSMIFFCLVVRFFFIEGVTIENDFLIATIIAIKFRSVWAKKEDCIRRGICVAFALSRRGV